MLTPSLTSWRAQYERMHRSYARICQPYQSSVEYGDDLQHFFQDCWHLKDWLKNDPGAGVAAQIETEVGAEHPLRIAADLANAAKHLARHHGREGAYVTSTNVTVHLAQNKPIDVEFVVTLDDGSTLSAQQLAHDAIQSWAHLLNRLALSP